MERITITVLEGRLAGQRQEFQGQRIVLGRRSDCDFRLDPGDDKASGHHAEILRIGGQIVLRDLKATNGTFVEGIRVTGDYSIKSGDRIQLGKNGPVVRAEWHVQDATSTQSVDLDSVALDAGAGGGKTAFYKAMVVETVNKSSRRLRYAIAGLVAALALAVIVVVVILKRQGHDTQAAMAKAESATQSQGAAERIATENEKTLFMLIAKKGEVLEGYCTAFAVSPDGALATNAHCTRALEAYRDKGFSTVARMNRHPSETFPVTDWKTHPDYSGDPRSADVALVRLDLGKKTLPAVATLADTSVLRALTAGQAVFTLGFPGQVMNEAQPAADLRNAVVSRVTDYQNTPGTPATAQMVWHNALTSKGTSGSPLFDESGKVIAINNGGLSAKTVTVADPKTGALRAEVTYEATGLNFGIRADVLQSLFAR